MSTTSAKQHDIGAYYDEVPYKSASHPHSQPPHVSTLARLFGLNSPDFKKARVLEIGCAGGGNLLPLALAYPEARFLGLDISQKQILEANQQKALLKLDNAEFNQMDLMAFDVKAHQGKFDYIIAHGVFSWVPDEVREKLLAVCGECLSPDGLAVISFNTLPGWNAVRSLRDMMLYHTSAFSSHADKVAQARFVVDFVGELVPQNNVAHRAVFDELRPFLKGVNDAYIQHEYLENSNTQFHFHEFMTAARKCGLDYVADADLGSMYYSILAPEIVNLLKELKANVVDAVSHEQYVDFITNRRFRTAILCKGGRKINRDLRDEAIMDFSLAMAEGVSVDNPGGGQRAAFNKKSGGGFTTDDSISTALFLELAACDRMPIAAAELVTRVQRKLGLKDAQDVRNVLIAKGLLLAKYGFVVLHAPPPHHAAKVSDKPVAFPIARLQAARADWTVATNVIGQDVPNGGVLDKQILQFLDGSKNIEQLVDIAVSVVQKALQDGTVSLNGEDGLPLRDASLIRGQLAAMLTETLQRFARQGLLIG